ncbi:hypothetical protein HF086_005387 [Spodoptera exigua]|uniref:Uncharacterized protein n=1 Tax=Spodoptera exigua TaxID=7107 RepID=A0A922M2Y7_SPOEX|nr:hypothetical protein HF086_005387 [Spodoptera exigua]
MSSEKILHEDNGSSSGSLRSRSEDSDSNPDSATDSSNSLFKNNDNTCAETCIEETKCEVNKKRGTYCNPVVQCVWGVLLVLLSISSFIFTPLDFMLLEKLNMRPGMPPYEWWSDPPDEVKLRVYVFNVTNHERFLLGLDHKLNVEEVGPVVYLEKLLHSNVRFNENSTMTYTAKRFPIFLPDLNHLDLNATIIVPNVGVLGIFSYLHNANYFVKTVLRSLVSMYSPEPFVQVSIYDYLWNFTDPVLEMSRNLVPGLVPVSNAGMLARVYADFTDEMTVKIGPQWGHKQFFQIDRFRGQPQIPGFDPDYTGTPFEAVARMQSNLLVHDLTGFQEKFANVSNSVIPLFWAEYTTIKNNNSTENIPDKSYNYPEPKTLPGDLSSTYQNIGTSIKPEIHTNIPTTSNFQPISGQPVFPKYSPNIDTKITKIVWTPIQVPMPVCWNVEAKKPVSDKITQTSEYKEEILVQTCDVPLSQRFVNNQRNNINKATNFETSTPMTLKTQVTNPNNFFNESNHTVFQPKSPGETKCNGKSVFTFGDKVESGKTEIKEMSDTQGVLNNLDSNDLRFRLLAKRKKSVDFTCEPAVENLDKLSTKLNSLWFKDIQTFKEPNFLENAQMLKNNKIWFMTVDTEVLLLDYEAIETIVKADDEIYYLQVLVTNDPHLKNRASILNIPSYKLNEIKNGAHLKPDLTDVNVKNSRQNDDTDKKTEFDKKRSNSNFNVDTVKKQLFMDNDDFVGFDRLMDVTKPKYSENCDNGSDSESIGSDISRDVQNLNLKSKAFSHTENIHRNPFLPQNGRKNIIPTVFDSTNLKNKIPNSKFEFEKPLSIWNFNKRKKEQESLFGSNPISNFKTPNTISDFENWDLNDKSRNPFLSKDNNINRNQIPSIFDPNNLKMTIPNSKFENQSNNWNFDIQKKDQETVFSKPTSKFKLDSSKIKSLENTGIQDLGSKSLKIKVQTSSQQRIKKILDHVTNADDTETFEIPQPLQFKNRTQNTSCIGNPLQDSKFRMFLNLESLDDNLKRFSVTTKSIEELKDAETSLSTLLTVIESDSSDTSEDPLKTPPVRKSDVDEKYEFRPNCKNLNLLKIDKNKSISMTQNATEGDKTINNKNDSHIFTFLGYKPTSKNKNDIRNTTEIINDKIIQDTTTKDTKIGKKIDKVTENKILVENSQTDTPKVIGSVTKIDENEKKSNKQPLDLDLLDYSETYEPSSDYDYENNSLKENDGTTVSKNSENPIEDNKIVNLHYMSDNAVCDRFENFRNDEHEKNFDIEKSYKHENAIEKAKKIDFEGISETFTEKCDESGVFNDAISDLNNDFCGRNDNDGCDSSVLVKDDVTNDSGFENESTCAHITIKIFFNELSTTFKAVNNFITNFSEDLQKRGLDEKNRNAHYQKATKCLENMEAIILRLESIIKRETEEVTVLKTLLLKAGLEATNDKRVTRYR